MSSFFPEQILTVELRAHQLEAVHALSTAQDKFAYAEMSVASGKSLVMAQLAKVALPQTRVVIIAHTEELVKQNAKACRWLGLKPTICCSSLNEVSVFGRLTVGTIGTLAGRIDYFKDAGLIIIDEVHRARMEEYKDGSASQYLLVKESLPNSWFRGLTGTGWREDGSGSLENTFGRCVYKYGFLEAMEDGFVKPLRAVAAKAPEIKTEGLKVNAAGEWGGHELTNRGVVLAPLHAAATLSAIREEGRRRVLVFACDIAHADALEGEFRKLGVDARAVHTGKKGCGGLVEEFRRGAFPLMISVAKFNCLDLETEVLTARGWKRHDEITEEDEVANWTSSGFVFFKKPKRIIHGAAGPDSPMYAARGNRHDLRVTSGHRVVHSSGQSREAESVRVEAAAALAGRKIQIPVSGYAEPLDVKPAALTEKKRAARRRSLECHYRRKKGLTDAEARAAAAAHYGRLDALATAAPSSLSLDECRFIGFWLGDGTAPQSKSSGRRWSVTQSTANFKIGVWFGDLVKRIGLHHTLTLVQPGNGAVASRWNFSTGRGGGAQARSGGIHRYAEYLNKEGSALYRGLDRQQILALLEGFWMADGNHGIDGAGGGSGWCITGTQKRLYDVIQSVLAVRGVDSSITKCAPPKEERWSQTYSFSWNDMHLGWRTLTLHADTAHCEERREEPVWCVQSHSTFIITRRNGKVAVTGNTGFDVPDIDFMAFCRPMKSGLLYAQSLGRGARLSEIASDCVVVDFGGNITRHGALDMVRPPKRRPTSDGKADDPSTDPKEKLDSLERTVGGDLRKGAIEGSLLSRHSKPKWVEPTGSPTFLVGRHLWLIPTSLGPVRWFSPSYPLDSTHLFCEYDPRHGWTARGARDAQGLLRKA